MKQIVSNALRSSRGGERAADDGCTGYGASHAGWPSNQPSKNSGKRNSLVMKDLALMQVTRLSSRILSDWIYPQTHASRKNDLNKIPPRRISICAVSSAMNDESLWRVRS